MTKYNEDVESQPQAEQVEHDRCWWSDTLSKGTPAAPHFKPLLGLARKPAGVVGLVAVSRTAKWVIRAIGNGKVDSQGRVKRTAVPFEVAGIPAVALDHTCEVLGRNWGPDEGQKAEQGWTVLLSVAARVQPLLGQEDGEGAALWSVS